MNLDFDMVIVTCCIPETNESHFRKNICNDNAKHSECWDGGQSTTLTIFSGKMGKRSKYVIAKNGTSALLNVVSYKIDELWHLKLSPL